MSGVLCRHVRALCGCTELLKLETAIENAKAVIAAEVRACLQGVSRAGQLHILLCGCAVHTPPS